MSNDDFESWTADEINRIQTGVNLKRPSDHQSMFKYISLNNESSWNNLGNTLCKQELIGSPADRLNDPFEQSPYIFDDLQPSTVATAVRHTTSPFLERPARPLHEVFPSMEPYRHQARTFLESASAHYRIISFSERSDSGLLWSHYANGYQGACLHFLAKGLNARRGYTLGCVSYSKYRPAYPLSLALSLSSKPGGPDVPVNASTLRRAENEKLLFFTKSEDWSYESEMRVVYDSRKSSSAVFREDGLVAIITGPRFSDENLLRLTKLVEGSQCKNLPIRRARLSKTTFSVEIEP